MPKIGLYPLTRRLCLEKKIVIVFQCLRLTCLHFFNANYISFISKRENFDEKKAFSSQNIISHIKFHYYDFHCFVINPVLYLQNLSFIVDLETDISLIQIPRCFSFIWFFKIHLHISIRIK